ncbi:MAG: amidohydrolase family protein [Gemmataceae bacterium]|nr:amidohydrolase family protein [Gemmataceae bacterium]MDW8266057.1 N-acetylglucosamine-6-phosphate deacetylase [Gemmataceae bacterium]
MRLRGRHYATGEKIDVDCRGERIVAVRPADTGQPDREAEWIAPAFFDLQINGGDGHAFNSERLTADQVRHVVGVCRRHGIGQLLPTLVTNSFEALRHGLTTLRQCCEDDPALAHALPGIHLEGPYISPEDGPRGAHPRAFVRPPDWDEFCRLQEVAGGRIRLVTLAPEHEGALGFIERLTASGVVVALGHTAASAERLGDAVAAGARLSTHLGNGAHAVLPRHPNYIWDQLADDRLWASIICDGHHLPASVVRCIVRVKTPARIILTCDASSLAGLPPGRYREWDQEFEVLPIGKIVVSGTSYLAGSWAFTDRCVGGVMRMAEVSLAEAIDMASARPRELLGLPAQRLAAGEPADLVLFDWQPGDELRVRATVIAGSEA